MLAKRKKMETRKQPISMRAHNCAAKVFRSVAPLLLIASLLVLYARPKNKSEANQTTAAAIFDDPLALVLTPQTSDSRIDKEISQLQQRIRDGRNIELWLERLGWAFVAKARESFDPGFYKLAEQCARSIEKRNPQSQEAMLLQAHVLQNLHRFNESEALARRLVQQRGLSFDYGLLGDALMEQGRLNDAVEAYQRMMNLKPDLRAYARADQFQAGRFEEAEQRRAFALSLQTNYPPALLLKGRMLLAKDESREAVDPLQNAAKLNPLPEYQWVLAEALRAAGREEEASRIEAQLRQHGASGDPRTLALFLSTRHEFPETALRLARAELDSRSDVFTHDALAWSLAAAGKLREAHSEMQRALAEGTEDGRLFFHAAVIASKTGHTAETDRWLRKANELSHLLLPSERNQLHNAAASDAKQQASLAPNQKKTFPLGRNTARKARPQPQTKT